MKRVFICLVIILLACSNVYSKAYKSQNFVIHSDLDPRYIEFIQLNIESFYEKILPEYFSNGWQEPLAIYYSKSQSDTQKLIAKFGHNDDIGYGVYISDLKAIFTHRVLDSGGLSGLGTVYHEIIHALVELNYKRAPTWFNEGLATFLGEQTRCVNDKLTLGRPNPWRELILRGMIEDGHKIDVKHLTSLSTSQFYRDSDNYHPTRALFYWIYQSGNLDAYLENVKKQGYDLDVLERTVGKSCDRINFELLGFIKSNCYPAASYKEGLSAKTLEDKKRFYQKSLQIKPDYYPAKLELAECFYEEGNFKKCKDTLSSILDDPNNKEFYKANRLIARIYHKQKEYSKALEYYQKAWESSLHNEYRYQNAFSIGLCYHSLRNYSKAKHWFNVFIEENWEPGRLNKRVKYAKAYNITPKQ